MASIGHCDILCERLEHLGVWDPRGVVEAIPTDTEEWLFIKPMFLAAQIPQLKAKGPWAAWGIEKGQRLLFSCPSPTTGQHGRAQCGVHSGLTVYFPGGDG